MISHARKCGYAWIKAAKDRGIDVHADKDGYLAVISGLLDELESDATRCPNCDNLRLDRNDQARWRQDLADKLDEVERHRDAIAVALNKCADERDSAIRERDAAKVDLEEVCDARDRLVEIEERRRKLLERVLQCGLCEEPHGVGFTPSRQERIASDLARDIGNELRGIDALVKG